MTDARPTAGALPHAEITRPAAILLSGGLVALPTETVYRQRVPPFSAECESRLGQGNWAHI